MLAAPDLKSVAVIGAGGNIGSHLVPHLGRMPGIERVTLVDCDRYEEKNLATQDIVPRDVGRAKADVQARRLRQIQPRLDVQAIHERVERVPLGLLRASVLIACVDSRIARQSINQIAWRLNAKLIDAGVAAGGELLARVNVYLPGRDTPCVECAWDDRDYALLEVRHPCQSEAAVASTNAPSMLGALAASLAAIECHKLLDSDVEHALAGRQVVVDARHHTHFVTSYRRNPRCRFDHQTWSIQPAGREPKELRLKDLEAPRVQLWAPWVLGQAASDDGINRISGVAGVERSEPPAERATHANDPNGHTTLHLEGDRFLLRPFCPNGCGLESKRSPEVLGLASRLPERWTRCPKCKGPLIPRGWDMTDHLTLESLQTSTRRRTLASLGLQPHDVITLTRGTQDLHIELGPQPTA